jgi:hypothetical protein
MSLYWASGHRQIQTLGDVRLILPRFWWSRNPYLIPQPAKEDKPFWHCISKNLMKKEGKNLEGFMPAKTVSLNQTKTEFGSTKLFSLTDGC